jgi:hypothetical protein
MLSQIRLHLIRSGLSHVQVSEFIGFYSLRTWGHLNGKFVCDQIYVHDKVRSAIVLH